MSAEGVLRFVAVVELHFPRPKFNDDERMEAAWLASMQRSLGGYDDDVLSEAAQRILRDRSPKKDGRFFPVPSECEDACKEALKLKRARETPLLASPQNVPYEARANLAADIMKSPLGVRAHKEGWDVPMFHFCVDHMRAPSGKEIDECKRHSDEFAAERDRCIKGERKDGKTWASIADGIVRKAREAMEKSA